MEAYGAILVWGIAPSTKVSISHWLILSAESCRSGTSSLPPLPQPREVSNLGQKERQARTGGSLVAQVIRIFEGVG
jgi:hypothetical protein